MTRLLVRLQMPCVGCSENFENGETKIKEYCNLLRYEIDLTSESAIEAIDKKKQELNLQVDDYEKSLLDSFKYKFCQADDDEAARIDAKEKMAQVQQQKQNKVT